MGRFSRGVTLRRQFMRGSFDGNFVQNVSGNMITGLYAKFSGETVKAKFLKLAEFGESRAAYLEGELAKFKTENGRRTISGEARRFRDDDRKLAKSDVAERLTRYKVRAFSLRQFAEAIDLKTTYLLSESDLRQLNDELGVGEE